MGKLRILPGRQKIDEWQPGDPLSEKRVADVLARYERSGWTPFVDDEARVHQFDPDAEEIVLVPRIAGGGGPDIKPSQKISETQQTWSAEDRARMEELYKLGLADIQKQNVLTQPAIDFNTAMASGDQTKMLQAAGPMIKTIGEQAKAAKENAYLAPRGAGQDFAMSQIPVLQAGQTAEAMSRPYLSSFDTLANIGNVFGQRGLNIGSWSQRAGESGLTGLSQASQTQRDVMEAQAKRQQAKMGLWGGIAQTVGGLATGGALGAGLTGASKAGTANYSPYFSQMGVS